MKKLLVFCIQFFLLNFSAISQVTHILHYTETSGYDHQTRQVSYDMFSQMGIQNGFLVDNDSTGDAFNTLSNLQQYDVVVYANTTGDAILDSNQQQNFVQYIGNGGNLIGIHSATDTYRHSTANGTNTGVWDWYAELLGASVRVSPSHVDGTPVYNLLAQTIHPLLANIPDPWNKSEEYYYWEDGYFNASNVILQKVEQTIGPNGQVNSYDSSRAITWYRELPAGQRIFYTALGHDVTNYTTDTVFYQLLENAILWAGNSGSGSNETELSKQMHVFPNPFINHFSISVPGRSDHMEISLYDLSGREVLNKLLSNLKMISVPETEPGYYFLRIKSGNEFTVLKLLKLSK